MWTDEHRKLYARPCERYPSDLSDAEWALLEPLIPPPKPGGRPRETDMREATNAILYVLRTGCPWRYIPKDFPPRSTVYNIFVGFKRDGVWTAIWEQLHMDLREAAGREASPTAAIIDSQSLKSAEKGGATTVASATMPARRSKGARSTRLSTPRAFPSGSSSIPRRSRTATARS